MIESSPAHRFENIVVQKFGGSSLATRELRLTAVRRVAEAKAAGQRPVVVVSAVGRSPGPYATDTLLGLVGAGAGAQVRDLIMSCGETISAAIFSAMLALEGIDARPLTGAQAGIFTDDAHCDARIVRVAPARIVAVIEEGAVPVVAGFQGVAPNGDITTIGRGGSDLTAVALGCALGNADVEIYTDVDGVLTSDPRRSSRARTVDALTFDEMSELAHSGAKVMHAKAADLARTTGTKLRVLGLMSRTGSTVDLRAFDDARGPVVSLAASAGFAFAHVTTSVPHTHVTASSTHNSPDRWKRAALDALADADVNLECVSVNASGLYFAVRASSARLVAETLSPLPVQVELRDACARIALVGSGLRETPGVLHRTIDALDEAAVPLIGATDSPVAIVVIVPELEAARAESVLLREFDLLG